MSLPQWRLCDLAENDQGKPAQTAYSAMVFLTAEPFLRRTVGLRSREVHRGRPCPHGCDACTGVALQHSWAATKRLHRRLRDGPPRTKGELVRDWVTILSWLHDADQRLTPLTAVRDGLLTRLSREDPVLPFVHAFATQFGFAGHNAATRRKQFELFNDALRSFLASERNWGVHPARDFLHNARLASHADRRPMGARLFVEILRHLERGHGDAFEKVCRPGATPEEAEAQDQLADLLGGLLTDPYGADWFSRNVIARIAYYESDRELPGDPGSWNLPPGAGRGA